MLENQYRIDHIVYSLLQLVSSRQSQDTSPHASSIVASFGTSEVVLVRSTISMRQLSSMQTGMVHSIRTETVSRTLSVRAISDAVEISNASNDDTYVDDGHSTKSFRIESTLSLGNRTQQFRSILTGSVSTRELTGNEDASISGSNASLWSAPPPSYVTDPHSYRTYNSAVARPSFLTFMGNSGATLRRDRRRVWVLMLTSSGCSVYEFNLFQDGLSQSRNGYRHDFDGTTPVL